MVFSEPVFLFLFLPIALAAISVAIAAGRGHRVAIFLFSLVFYYWSSGLFVLMLLDLPGEVRLPNGIFRVSSTYAGSRRSFRHDPIRPDRAVLVGADGKEIELEPFTKKPLPDLGTKAAHSHLWRRIVVREEITGLVLDELSGFLDHHFPAEKEGSGRLCDQGLSALFERAKGAPGLILPMYRAILSRAGAGKGKIEVAYVEDALDRWDLA